MVSEPQDLSNKTLDAVVLRHLADAGVTQTIRASSVAPQQSTIWYLPEDQGQPGESMVLGAGGQLEWQPTLPASYVETWSGTNTELSVTHGLQSENISAIVYDDGKKQVWVDEVYVIDESQVRLTVSEKPNQTWTVILAKQ